MGRSTIFLVLAAVVGGSYLTFNVLRSQTDTIGRRSNAQSVVLARQLAESGQAIALSSITKMDGFENDGVFTSDRDYNGGTISFEDYDASLSAATPNGERVAIQVAGQYGGATHRLSSVYEFDPMDFPGPLWLDVPYAAATIHPNASFSGGAFGYEPQVDPTKFNEFGVSSLGLSLAGVKGQIGGTGTSVPEWDIPNSTNDGLGRTEDLGEGIHSADDLYFQVRNAIDTDEGDTVIPGGRTISNTETFGTPETITLFEGDVNVPAGATLSGEGALIVEGDLLVKGQMTWDGIVIIRTEEQDLTIDFEGKTTITGALVVSQDAMPPGGHMDVSVYRQIDGTWSQPYGQKSAGPLAGARAPWATAAWPFWQHVHKFDYPGTGAIDAVARSEREVRLVDDSRGDPQEHYTGLREVLDHLGSALVVVEFDNIDKHGNAVVQMEVDGEDPINRSVTMGFADTALEGSDKHTSAPFSAEDLEQLIVQPQSLRSLRKLWDSDGVCAGASPAQWPVCVGYDRTDRHGALTMRLRRATGAILYETTFYWHMQAGAEHVQHLAEVAAWQAQVSSGTTPFGTTFKMGASSSVTYDLVPIVSLADKIGFDGNEVIHISTESSVDDPDQMIADGTSTGPSTSPPSPTGGSGGTTATAGGGNTGGGNTGGGNTGGGNTGGGNTGGSGTTASESNPDPDGDGLVTVCHTGRGGEETKTYTLSEFAAHVTHVVSYGPCPTASPLAAIVATPNQRIPTNNQEWVMMCHAPYGANPAWRTEEVKYHQFLRFRESAPGSVLGACAEHGR